ncbi:MAG: hypothetical protein JWL77_4538 [Chthonomonadaceae bacterium]|nr:hypothetical protein [Chthonomonadaceae bacterium]
MAKYLMQAAYTSEGLKGLAKEGGSKRKDTVQKAIEQLGGRLEVFYYAFGEADVYLIVELPDVVAASALSMAVNASGAVRLRTTPLLTVEEVDRAIANNVAYRAPGT